MNNTRLLCREMGCCVPFLIQKFAFLGICITSRITTMVISNTKKVSTLGNTLTRTQQTSNSRKTAENCSLDKRSRNRNKILKPIEHCTGCLLPAEGKIVLITLLPCSCREACRALAIPAFLIHWASLKERYSTEGDFDPCGHLLMLETFLVVETKGVQLAPNG